MTTPARTTAPLRRLVAALALLAGAAAGVALPSPTAAAADSCDGVWVVVDATRLGGSVRTLCAPGSPSSGLDALRLAGVDYTFVERQPGLVCTLDGQPDPCNGAPTDAYWGYWHAEAGGDWIYSTRGAGNRTPAKGSVEGWAFGAGQPPGRTPPAAPADPEPTAEPSPESTAEPAPAPSPNDAPARAGDGGDREPAGDRDAAQGEATADPAPRDTAAEPADQPAADGAAEDDTADGAADDAAGDPQVDASDPDDDADVAATPDDATSDDAPSDDGTGRDVADDEVALGDVAGDGGGGAPVGAIAGGVLVAGLAGAGVLRARRRTDLGEG